METNTFRHHLINSINNPQLYTSFTNDLFFKCEFSELFGPTRRDLNLLRVFILSRVVNKFPITDEHELLRITEAIIKSTKGNEITIYEDIKYVIKNDKQANTVYALSIRDNETKYAEASMVLSQLNLLITNNRHLLSTIDSEQELLNKVVKYQSIIDKKISEQPTTEEKYHQFLDNILSFIDKIIIQRFKETI